VGNHPPHQCLLGSSAYRRWQADGCRTGQRQAQGRAGQDGWTGRRRATNACAKLSCGTDSGAVSRPLQHHSPQQNASVQPLHAAALQDFHIPSEARGEQRTCCKAQCLQHCQVAKQGVLLEVWRAAQKRRGATGQSLGMQPFRARGEARRGPDRHEMHARRSGCSQTLLLPLDTKLFALAPGCALQCCQCLPAEQTQ